MHISLVNPDPLPLPYSIANRKLARKRREPWSLFLKRRVLEPFESCIAGIITRKPFLHRVLPCRLLSAGSNYYFFFPS